MIKVVNTLWLEETSGIQILIDNLIGIDRHVIWSQNGGTK